MKITAFSAIAILIFFYSCGTRKAAKKEETPVAVSSESDLERGQKVFPDLTQAQLDQGKADYSAFCQKCHGLKDPTDYTEAEWRRINPGMAKKAKIDAEKEASILKYVVTMCTAKNK